MKIISSPVVREAITGGAGNISGNFSFQDATDLALTVVWFIANRNKNSRRKNCGT